MPPDGGSLILLERAFDHELGALAARDLQRILTTIDAVEGVTVQAQGRRLVSWCTNDYLGLSQHPRLIRAAHEAASTWGVGARASRLLAGSTQLHAQLEAQLASFFHAEAAATFASGYLANAGVLGCLLTPKDLVLVDRLAHASLIDACRLTRATLRVFRHQDAGHVDALLARAPSARRRLIVTEGVFSMDGDAAPLRELLEVARRRDAHLYLDDAHGAFVVGATGRGSPEAAGVAHERLLYMATLGKALGCQGGFVVGSRSLIRLIHHRARTFIYATAAAPPVIGAALEALRVVEDEPAWRTRLAQNVQRLHERLGRLAPGPAVVSPAADDTPSAARMVPPQSPSHIVPIIMGTARRARELAAALWEQGMFAPAIRPPTVPEGTARLRISLTALHTAAQIDQLASALRSQAELA